MPLTKVQFKPGITSDVTSYTNEGGWFNGDKIRFRLGFPEKIGGWTKQSANTYLGSARDLLNWVALDGSNFLGLGTELKYYIEEGGAFSDITPLRVTTSAGDVTFSGNTSTTGNASISGNVSIADSKFINVGAGPDLQVYHNATDSFIENNTGELFVQGDNITVRSDTGTETFLTMDVNNGVDIFYDNTKKIETTSAGVTVTGALTVSTTVAATNIGNITARNLITTTSTATPDNSAGADGDFYLIHDA